MGQLRALWIHSTHSEADQEGCELHAFCIETPSKNHRTNVIKGLDSITFQQVSLTHRTCNYRTRELGVWHVWQAGTLESPVTDEARILFSQMNITVSALNAISTQFLVLVDGRGGIFRIQLLLQVRPGSISISYLDASSLFSRRTFTDTVSVQVILVSLLNNRC